METTQKFNHHFTKINTAINTYLYRLGIPLQDKEDLKQEIFIKVFDNIHAYDPEKMKVHTFVYPIAKSAFIDANRKATAKKRGGKNLNKISLDFQFDEEGNTLHDLVGQNDNIFDDASVLRSVLNDALSKMNDKMRLMYDLYFVNQMTYLEIQAETNFPMGTVKSLIYLIRKDLSQRLKSFEVCI